MTNSMESMLIIELLFAPHTIWTWDFVVVGLFIRDNCFHRWQIDARPKSRLPLSTTFGVICSSSHSLFLASYKFCSFIIVGKSGTGRRQNAAPALFMETLGFGIDFFFEIP